MSKNIAIKVQNITKTYKLYNQPLDRLKESLHPMKKKYHKEFHALQDVSFEIKKGETVGIIGRNGSGKSTLLKIITGVLTPSSGHVHVTGKISAILELGAGFNPEMTGIENIYLNSTINGLSKKDTDQHIDEIVKFSELGQFIYQPVKTYSSGMKARLAFGVAIHVNPDILIVDEALSVGDAAFQRKCFAKMEEIRKSGATILFVSHSEGSIVNLCNRAIWVHGGEQILDGNPKEVTGLYLKYSYQNKLAIPKIHNEYTNLLLASHTENAEKHSIENEDAPIKDFYNPALKPKSTILYETKGAEITDVEVTTLEGRKVNVLINGKEYIFTYKITPLVPLTHVNFGFLIKKKNGVALGGGSFPGKLQYIETMNQPQRVYIHFLCNLNNGNYFFNAGCMAKINEKMDYAHRILDAYMIKVIDAKNETTWDVDFIRNWSLSTDASKTPDAIQKHDLKA